MKFAALSSMLLCAATAYATTADCTGAADGTPCTATCIAYGQCEGGRCVVQNLPGTQTPGYAPDGAPCSSGNRCTSSDACAAGQCMPGVAVTCPALDQCHIGSCEPAIGCVYVVSCVPDMAPPADLQSSDLISPPADLANPDLMTVASSPPDLANRPVIDMASAAPLDMVNRLAAVDMAPVNQTVDMQRRTDLAPPADQATSELDGGVTVYPHVRGESVIDGCNVGGSNSANALPVLVILVGSAIRYRFRSTAQRHG